MDYIEKLDRGVATDSPKQRRKLRDKPDKGDGYQVVPPPKKKGESRQLKKKLDEYAQLNENLSRTLNDKNVEIAELKRSVQSLSEVLNSVPIDELRCNSSIASSKLLELSKKNRQLRAELESCKTRANKKDLQIQKLERELRLVEEKFHIDVDEVRKSNDPSDDIRAKFSALQQKFFDTRNRNVELQNQLKLAQKCLQQEVGENFNLNTLVTQPQLSNWRGRQQQILHLQQRVHELKERLDLYEQHSVEGRTIISNGNNGENLGPRSSDTSTSRQSGALPKSGTHSAGAIRNTECAVVPNNSLISLDRFTSGVRKTEILHRAKVEKLEKEIESLKTQLEDQRGKVLALKVRNKTLNEDVVKYRSKASSLEEQTDFNGLNIANMNEKMAVQRREYEKRLEEQSRQITDMKRMRKEAELREEELRSKLDNMDNMLETKDLCIEEQNQLIRKLEIDLKALSGGFLFSCRELRKEEFILILDSLEAEKNQLLEYNKTLVDRTDQERAKNESLVEALSKQKVRIARLEARVREQEKELEAQAERKKRSQRITDYVNSVTSFPSAQSSVQSFVFENTGLSAPTTPSETLTPAQVSDLKHQLEYAKEKLTFLEEKVSHLKEEKENDQRAFSNIINCSKTVILETITNNKSETKTALEEKTDTKSNTNLS